MRRNCDYVIVKCKECKKTIAHFIISSTTTRPLWINTKNVEEGKAKIEKNKHSIEFTCKCGNKVRIIDLFKVYEELGVGGRVKVRTNIEGGKVIVKERKKIKNKKGE